MKHLFKSCLLKTSSLSRARAYVVSWLLHEWLLWANFSSRNDAFLGSHQEKDKNSSFLCLSCFLYRWCPGFHSESWWPCEHDNFGNTSKRLESVWTIKGVQPLVDELVQRSGPNLSCVASDLLSFIFMKASLEDNISTFDIRIMMDEVNRCCYNFFVRRSFNVPNSIIGFTWGKLVINIFCNYLKSLSPQWVEWLDRSIVEFKDWFLDMRSHDAVIWKYWYQQRKRQGK